jgi:hypothetical protein
LSSNLEFTYVLHDEINKKLPGLTTRSFSDKHYPPNVIRLSKIICAFITELKYTAIFYFYMLSIFYFLFSRVFFLFYCLYYCHATSKKDDTNKLASPLQSLVRISTARANAHNTIAHFRHTQITKIKNSSSGTTCLFITYNGFFTLTRFF